MNATAISYSYLQRKPSVWRSLVRVAVFHFATVRTKLGDGRSLWWLFKAALFFSDLAFVSPGAAYCL